MKTRGFDPAFACAADGAHQEGMTKREKFAESAMQALLSNPVVQDLWTDEQVSAQAVKSADELIKALNKNTEG